MIITSLLDLDFYKFTMMYFVWKFYRDVHVTYGFTNRTKSVPLARIIDIGHLRDELDSIKSLKVTKEDIAYLSGESGAIPKGMFEKGFLDDLSNLQMSDYLLDVDESGDQFIIQPDGSWFDSILWETFILSTVNELFYRYQYADDYDVLGRVGILESRGVPRLEEKVRLLREHPDITFVEFGTRRRFEKQWQLFVNAYFRTHIPNQYLGSSNVFISRILNQKPMGTMAHEIFMTLAGLNSSTDEGIVGSFDTLVQQWFSLYGESLSVALTDTFGTDFFFRKFRPYASEWKGLRHDSGDPIVFGEKAIKFYEQCGIDPKTKLLFFSDGLDVHEMVRIRNHFVGRIGFSFGVGTHFTNDVGYPTLSIVVKAIAALRGFSSIKRPLVKLSDNLAKAIGNPKEVERYKRIHGYTNEDTQECVV